jgi:hypothetical protein
VDFAARLQDTDTLVQGHLGQSVTYTPGGGAAATVRGVFDRAYQRVEAGEADVSSSGPAVFVTLADLGSDPETDDGARVTVAGETYRIREVQPDGTGGAMLLLHLV